MVRKLNTLLCLMLGLAAWGVAAEPAAVTIMTQNMDAGTDLTFVVAELMGMLPPGVGVELTYQEVLSSEIPERADLLAAAVAAQKPDLLVLQEVTLWRTGETVETATAVVADQLQLLLSGLAARHVPYDVVAVNTVIDMAIPRSPSGALRMTDRDVILKRADLRPPAFHLSDVHANIFSAVYSLGGLEAPAGWIAATVHLGNRHFRLLTTHLESPVAGDPRAAAVHEAQAKELLSEAAKSTVPVVIAGDLNSDAVLASGGPGPDNTDTAALIGAAGFIDAWTAAGTGSGYTWPLYAQDQFNPPSFVAPAIPYERIDLIFAKGLNVIGVEQVLAPASSPNQPQFYGSDHAGVMATLQF